MHGLFWCATLNDPEVKIIAIGAVDSAREVVQSEPEMRNRVSEIAVPLMTPEELSEIVTKGAGLLRVPFRSGEILAFDAITDRFEGKLRDQNDNVIVLPGSGVFRLALDRLRNISDRNPRAARCDPRSGRTEPGPVDLTALRGRP